MVHINNIYQAATAFRKLCALILLSASPLQVCLMFNREWGCFDQLISREHEQEGWLRVKTLKSYRAASRRKLCFILILNLGKWLQPFKPPFLLL